MRRMIDYAHLRGLWTHNADDGGWHKDGWTIELVRGESTHWMDAWSGYSISRHGVTVGLVHATLGQAMRAVADAEANASISLTRSARAMAGEE